MSLKRIVFSVVVFCLEVGVYADSFSFNRNYVVGDEYQYELQTTHESNGNLDTYEIAKFSVKVVLNN